MTSMANLSFLMETFAENLRWDPHVHVLLLSGMANAAWFLRSAITRPPPGGPGPVVFL
jgi:hypothetical protein